MILTDASIRKLWASENGLEDCDMCKIDEFTQAARVIEAEVIAAIKERGAVAYQTPEGMLFDTDDEAASYCDDEDPVPLYSLEGLT